ncbi:TetR/AcrR family transcriptional regulator [Amnibacterium setariae]|uniref:TetR/AcrR family transcriptional regulator n=1 Tax=Amnibacterium setariae TaxID=2306585 RepID=A0A3A1TWF0_9MICO|nr:TetR/AcrR family transcriptional regulator [Amnibacterium setariae]RIX27881.1 TetR/AcrR family transcriptional regulator [Amnibacterium setariae]
MTPLDTVPAEPAVVDDQQVRLGRKRDHTRDPEILDATLELLAEQGYDRLTIDLVAARVKAGKATLYRRWPSKAELVIDAVACMKPIVAPEDAPDTGSLRGDLLALVRPHSLEESERKIRIMGGVASMLSRDPQLADAVNEAITEPRARLNRALIERAIARGEVAPRSAEEIDTIAHISPSMTIYRTIVQRKPVDREFTIGIIDRVVLPALGLRP